MKRDLAGVRGEGGREGSGEGKNCLHPASVPASPWTSGVMRRAATADSYIYIYI